MRVLHSCPECGAKTWISDDGLTEIEEPHTPGCGELVRWGDPQYQYEIERTWNNHIKSHVAPKNYRV